MASPFVILPAKLVNGFSNWDKQPSTSHVDSFPEVFNQATLVMIPNDYGGAPSSPGAPKGQNSSNTLLSYSKVKIAPC